MAAFQTGSILIAAAALILAAWHDLRTYLIPNRFAAAIAIAFPVFAVPSGLGTALFGAIAASAAFGFGMICFARGWLGGGDVKLLAAIALWVPASLVSAFALATALAGAALALLMLTPLHRVLPAPPADLLPAGTGGAAALRRPIPFGIAIALGGLFVLLRRMTG